MSDLSLDYIVGPKFTFQKCGEGGEKWMIEGSIGGFPGDLDPDFDASVEIATLRDSFIIRPDPPSESGLDLAMEADMVDGDAEASAWTYKAAYDANNEDFEFWYNGPPVWIHLGFVVVKEDCRGQRISHKMAEGLIEYMQALWCYPRHHYVITATCVEGLVPHWEKVGFKAWKKLPGSEDSYLLVRLMYEDMTMPPAEDCPLEDDNWLDDRLADKHERHR